MKISILLLLLVATPAFAGVGITMSQNGEIHCSGCRFKTIDNVKYVCTGSMSNEKCTKRDEWIRNVKDTKSASKNNEDMSYLQKYKPVHKDVCVEEYFNWKTLSFMERAVDCEAVQH